MGATILKDGIIQEVDEVEEVPEVEEEEEVEEIIEEEADEASDWYFKETCSASYFKAYGFYEECNEER